MLIQSIESLMGERICVGAAFPRPCGKTILAMMIPSAIFKGMKIRTIGYVIGWMKTGSDGRLYAVKREAGYFGVVPGTNSKSKRNAVEMISQDTIYTNVALTSDLDV